MRLFIYTSTHLLRVLVPLPFAVVHSMLYVSCWLWECLSLSLDVLVHLSNASVLRRSHQLQRPAMRTATTTTIKTTTSRRWRRRRQQELAQQNHTNLSSRLPVSVLLLRKCIKRFLIFASEFSIRCSSFSLLWLAVCRMTLHKPYIEHIYWNSLTLYIYSLEIAIKRVRLLCFLSLARLE